MHVTCVMPTLPGREALASRAIADFRRQTHDDRDMLVLAQASASHALLAADAARAAEGDDVRVVLVPSMPLGALRNASLDSAAGPVICQWDDDDRNHPERIATQLLSLQAAGKHSCFLVNQLYYYPEHPRPYLVVVDWTIAPTAGCGPYIPGTLMCIKSGVRYDPTLTRHEDTRFLQDEIRAHGGPAHVDRPGLYARTWHHTPGAANTTDPALAACNVLDRSWDRARVTARLAELRRDIRELGLPHRSIQLRAPVGGVHIDLDLSPAAGQASP